MQQDSISSQLNKWLTGLFADFKIDKLKIVAGDASFRNYYRFESFGCSYIVMHSKADPSLQRFIFIAEILKQQFINTPEILVPDILQVEPDLGFIVMSDLGDGLFLQELGKNNSQILYTDALFGIIKLQQIPITANLKLVNMDEKYIIEKLQVFKHWYLKKHLQISMNADLDKLLNKLANLFNKIFAAQNQVFVHLDYHSRNLLLVKNNNLGIIDFQDAMCGPVSYDLVSLLQDAYVNWPKEKIEKWLKYFYTENIKKIGSALNLDLNWDDFLKAFYITGLQRHLKNLGVFARLKHRDNKPGYLDSIPRLLDYIMATCERYSELPELSELLELFENKIINININKIGMV